VAAGSRSGKRVGDVAAYLVVIVWIGICLAPVAWMILQSLKPARETFAIPPTWFTDLGVQSYIDLFIDNPEFLQFGITSLVVTTGATLLSVLIGIPAAYALTFLPIRRRGLWLALVLLAAMLPPVALLEPLFELWRRLRLLNTDVALIATYASFSAPFAIWMLRGFMLDVPGELVEAARIDGAGHLQTLLHVIAPLVRPGIAATSIFIVIFAWNELLYSIILTTTHRTATGGVVATLFTDRVIGWGKVYAAGTLVVLPIIVFTVAVQRHFVRGLTLGAVKG
jgi:ABC-type glycerol-3-phosphate transport system permease component